VNLGARLAVAGVSISQQNAQISAKRIWNGLDGANLRIYQKPPDLPISLFNLKAVRCAQR
jgi:hypothetical protein